jgi:hypothetical protein
VIRVNGGDGLTIAPARRATGRGYGADGWISLVNLASQHRGTPVVINPAARNNLAVSKYGRTLELGAGEGSRDALINRQRDSVELLKEFMDALPSARVHVVRNEYFGAERKFEIYDASQLRALVEAQGGKSMTLPDGRQGGRRHLREAPVAERSGQDDAHRKSRRAQPLARGSSDGAFGALFGA